MAYFPNGTSGACFDAQCAQCRFGDRACPIYFVQSTHNYGACNNETARAILDHLVREDGSCAMFALEPECFRSDERNQMGLL